MTKAKRMLSLLLAVIMILSVIPITASAAENDGTAGGIKTDKKYDPESGYLTLEAYVTGESQTQIVAQPVDIALVLDVSGSMGVEQDNNDPYITVGNGTSVLDVLDTKYGGAEGIYIMRIRFIAVTREYKLRYHDGQWQYDKIVGSWTNLIGSGYEDRVKDTKIKKLDALKIAAKHFIDTVEAASDPLHPNRISIIKFAGEKKNTIGNETYSMSGTGTGWSNYSQIVQDLTSVNDNASTLRGWVDKLDASGATQADFGMQHAQTVLANTDSSRKKVVVMFTDGSPTSSSGFNSTVATGAISAAYDLKQSGASVYTVGVFNSDISSNVYPYMNLVSSNYPNAQSFDGSADSTVHDYFMTSDNSADLTNIFKKISQEIGGASVKLESKTVLKDTISGYFDLDMDGVDAKKITVHTETCTAINADGNPTAWDNDNNYGQYGYTLNDKTITVTGFDYSANWVGSHNGQPGGKKIVLKIPIKPIDSECWGLGLPTNDAANSGIYVDGKSVAPFPVPTVDYPYYEIVHVRMGADGKLVYTGDHSNAVIADPAAVNAENRVRITDNTATVDLTKKVPTGYLYGGSFSNKECTEAQTYDVGEDPSSFTPKSGQTYYIWEAPDVYLIPRSLSLYKTTNDVLDVIGFYLLTGVDRLYYQSAGFDVIASNGTTAPITDVNTKNDDQLKDGTNVYSSLIAKLTNGKEDKFEPGVGVFENLKAKDSRLVCFTVPKAYWNTKGDTITFTPYWITLDGMKVTGTTTRTCKYQGPGYKSIGKVGNDSVGQSEITPFSNTAVQMMLTACGSVTLDGSENEPSAPVDPVDPIDPVDPVDPIDPVDPVTPVDPVEPATQFSVTVHDGGSVYTLEAEAGEDITSRLVSAGMYGQLFAGWFLDERNTAAAELRNVQSDMDVYAKYVSDKFLTLRYRNVGLFRSRNVKLYAALDSADYAEAGFVINGQAVSCPITRDAYTAFFLFGSTVRENTTLVSCTYGTDGLRYGDTVEITPYWVTLDGTTVYGTTQTLTYGRFGLM